MRDKHITQFLFDKISNPSFIINPQGLILQKNSSANFNNSDFNSIKNIVDYFSKDIEPEIHLMINKAVSEGIPVTMSASISFDGLLTNLTAEFSQIPNEEQILIFVRFIFQNEEDKLRVSERQLIELNAAKDRLFSIISHDLRGSFNLILGLTQMLTNDISDFDEDKISEMAKVINESSERSFNLLINLLDWSRLQSGKILFNPVNFNLKELIVESIELQNSMAFNKKIKLKINVSDKIIIHADKKMLGTVLRNLLSNAYKFTPSKGKIDINASITDNETVITIKDSGVGIPADRIKNLFLLEHAVSETGTEDEKGTGLGLLLCKDFIDQHQGFIEIKSQLNEGSEFIIKIPLKKQAGN